MRAFACDGLVRSIDGKIHGKEHTFIGGVPHTVRNSVSWALSVLKYLRV